MRVWVRCGIAVAVCGVIFFLGTRHTKSFFIIAHEIIYENGKQIPLTVVRAPAAQIRMRAIATSSTPQYVSQFTSSNESVVVNGAYFDAQYVPSGFVASGGQVISSREFDHDKSAAIFFDDVMHIEEAGQENFLHAPESMQSYPLLVKNGLPQIATDSGFTARRSAVALDESGNVVIIVADAVEISLYEFANALTALQPHIQAAVNLDGGKSTGIAVRTGGHTEIIESYAPVGTALIFEKRAAP